MTDNIDLKAAMALSQISPGAQATEYRGTMAGVEVGERDDSVVR